MKKIIWIMCCFILFAPKVGAISKEKMDNIYYQIYGESEKRQMYYLHEGETPIYVYNPKLDGSLVSLEKTTLKEFPKEELEYVKFANYVSKDYKSNLKYYLAVQNMIWSKLYGVLIYFYDEYGNEISILKEYLDIRSKIESELIRPSFDNYTIQGTDGSTFEFEDANKQISKFEVVKDENEVNIVDNLVKITLYEPGIKQIIFEKVINNGTDMKVYQDSSEQIYLNMGDLVKVTSVLNTNNLTPIKEDFTLKIQSDNVPIQKKLELKFRDSNGITYSGLTDENGVYKGKLPVDTYRIEVLNLPSNFTNKEEKITIKDLKNQEFSVSFNEKRGKLTLRRKGETLIGVKKQNFMLDEITYSVYAKEDINTYLGKIYKKDELVTTLVTKNGEVYVSLPLGTYYIKEKSSLPYETYKEDFSFTFDDTSLTKTKTITTKHLSFKLDIVNKKKGDSIKICPISWSEDISNTSFTGECLNELEEYYVPFGVYSINLTRNGEIIKKEYIFSKSEIISLDFDELFDPKVDLDDIETLPKDDDTKNDSNLDNDKLDENNNASDLNDDKTDLIIKEDKTEQVSLPRTDDKNSDLKIVISGLTLLSVICLYFIKRTSS